MSIVRFIKVENRLAKLITAPGGKTLDDAIADAEANLGEVADACLADVDRLIGIVAGRAASADTPLGKDDPIYAAARDIAGVAALCKRACLGEAAHSLCVLIDLSEAAGRWRRDAVMVHVSTLQLLRSLPDEEGAMARQLLGSLNDMVKRLTEEDARAAG